MSLENAFIEQLAQYIEINYKEYLPVTDENILYEKYAPFVDIPERKELTRDQSMDLQHLLDEAGDSFHEKLFELIDKSGIIFKERKTFGSICNDIGEILCRKAISINNERDCILYAVSWN